MRYKCRSVSNRILDTEFCVELPFLVPGLDFPTRNPPILGMWLTVTKMKAVGVNIL